MSTMMNATYQRYIILVVVLVLLGLAIQFVWLAKRSAVYSSVQQKIVQGSPTPTIQPTRSKSTTGHLHKHTDSHNEDLVQPTPMPNVPPFSVYSVSETQKSQSHHLLVVIVLSKDRERRDAVRETWKSTHYHQPHYNVTVKFSLGTLGLNSTEVDELEDEEMEYNDLILLPQLKDAYNNLTRKVLYSLEWVDQHLNYSYVLKCDDDSFAFLDRMAHELANMSPDRGLYWGYFIGNAYPKYEGSWEETSWFACDIYMPYAYGGGYVLSSSVVRGLLKIADILIFYNSEDVAIGAWTSSFNIERKHDVRFDVQAVSRGCLNNFLVTHKQSIEDLYNKHKRLLTKNVLCEKENIWGQYIYDWKKKPTKCCKVKRAHHN